RPTLRRREHLAQEIRNRLWRRKAESRNIDCMGDGDPEEKDGDQQHAERKDADDRPRMPHVKGARPPEIKAQLPPAAQFIESEGGNGADQREAGGERKEQVKEVIQGQLGYYKS